MLHGIDVWSGNGVIQWPEVKLANNAFVFARAAYGNVEDKRAAANLEGIRDSGMPAGVYHFLRTSRDYQEQIDLMLELIDRLAIGPGDLPPALDVEDNPAWDGPTRAGFWETLGNPSGFSHCPLWVAYYGAKSPRLPAGWTDFTFWQYSESGSVQGVDSNAELNHFNGDIAALASLLLK